MLEVRIALLVKNTQKYVSRIYDGSTNYIKGVKDSIDSPSRFLIIPLNDTQIALQADNSNYLSRIQHSDGSYIEAEKSTIYDQSKFTVYYEAENLITLKADNNEYLHSGDGAFIKTTSDLNDSCRFYINTIIS